MAAEVHHLDEWRRPEGRDEPDIEPVVDIEPVEEEVGSDPPSPGLQGPDLEAEAREVRRALTQLIINERKWWELFEHACREGLIGLPERAARLAEILRERDLIGDLEAHVLQDAVEVTIPEMAVELLPDSPAASWERLLERVRREQPGWEDPSGAILRIAAADPRVFRRLTHAALAGPDQAELVAAAREVWGGLRECGHSYEPRGFSDHLWLALREIFPKAPGAAFDSNWAASLHQEVCRDLARRAGEAGVEVAAVDVSGVEAAEARMREAEEAEDRIGLREAARRAIRASKKAVQEAAAQAS